MRTNNTFIGEELIEGTPFKKKVYHVFNSGSCQCFGNCDCYKERGKFLGVLEQFSHPLSHKKYNSLEICRSAYEQKVKHINEAQPSREAEPKND